MIHNLADVNPKYRCPKRRTHAAIAACVLVVSHLSDPDIFYVFAICSRYSLQIPDLKFSLCLSLLIFLRDIIPLIIQLLTFGKSHFHLH